MRASQVSLDQVSSELQPNELLRTLEFVPSGLAFQHYGTCLAEFVIAPNKIMPDMFIFSLTINP
jgi:hypothetical protein